MNNSKLRGIALIQVLIMTAIMSLIAVQFSKTARHQVEIASDFNDRLSAELALKTAKSQLLFNLFKHDSIDLSDKIVNGVKWNLRGNPFKLSANVTVEIKSATALLSVLTTPSEYWKSVIIAQGLDQATADEIIASMQDWIDVDDNVNNLGAERAYYEPLSIIPRNGPFQHVSEFKYIKGVTPKLYRALKDHIIIYPTGSFNPALAAPELLTAIFPEDIALQTIAAQKTGLFTEQTWTSIAGNRQEDVIDIHPRSTFLIKITATVNDVALSEHFDVRVESQKSVNPIVFLANY